MNLSYLLARRENPRCAGFWNAMNDQRSLLPFELNIVRIAIDITGGNQYTI
jgi:hypothetical protein